MATQDYPFASQVLISLFVFVPTAAFVCYYSYTVLLKLNRFIMGKKPAPACSFCLRGCVFPSSFP